MTVYIVHMRHPESSADWIEGVYDSNYKAVTARVDFLKKNNHDGMAEGEVEAFEVK